MDKEAGKPNEQETGERPVEQTWQIPSDIEHISKMEEDFVRRMRENGWNGKVIEAMTIGFDEALKNALYHGNLQVGEVSSQQERSRISRERREQPEYGNKKITVKISIWPDKVAVVVTDEGKGFDWQTALRSDIGKDLLKESGRGLFFIRAFFDVVSFNEAGNEITMTKFKHGS